MYIYRTVSLIATLLYIILPSWSQKFDGLAPTPPMGWNSWNTFATDISEEMIKATADAFVELGFRDAGYQYLNLDDGWSAMKRNQEGELIGDPKKFPSGMKSLGDYIHGKGLKFGIYNCAGSLTCAKYPGSRGYEYQDARSYAAWGVDYLKYDWCNTEKLNAEGAYMTMRDALYEAGRPVVFSLCEWGHRSPWKWGKPLGHLWRVTGDIINCWDCEIGHGSWASLGIWKIINYRKEIRQYSGPNHWNDFDMMEVGNGMTDAEDRSHFAMWCMLSSPLIMGNDIRTASKETIKTLTNKEVIAIDQDPLGVPAYRHSNEDGFEIWAKPLANGEWAMTFINMKDTENELNFDWREYPIEDDLTKRHLELKNQDYAIRDLYNHKDLGKTNTNLVSKVGVHDVLMVRISK